MILDSNDDDSDSKESDLFMDGDDVDVYLNHYRIPKSVSLSKDHPLRSKGNREQVKCNHEGKIMSLIELAAQNVACHLPFGLVEHFSPPVPEPMQCRIAYWSFPQDEEDVRLYTCLANGNADVFLRAEDLISLNSVCDMLQVGFHLSANVRYIRDSNDDIDFYRVAITFDRRRITSCSCSCLASTFWCEHAVAVCLQRIRKPQEVTLRAPVSESLQRLEKNQLQKFAQYLINELPQQILPAAQKLLDELLSGDEAVINKNPGAPDPTAGATINEETSWCLDDTNLSQDIQKILLKQCTTQPTVCSDIQALHMTAPPAATEYSQLLRPIRGREPEGLWNLISIVGEMMKRRDSNFFILLEIMTNEVLKCDKVVTWWFETKVSLHSGSTIHCSTNRSSSQCTSQYSCSNFCDEIVHLWRLAAMNPSATATERKRLYKKFYNLHLDILKRHSAVPEGASGASVATKVNKRNLLKTFPGFKSAMEGCLIDWSNWDDKKGKLIDENDTIKKSKSSKSSKKKKKKAKQQAKQEEATVEPTPSTSQASHHKHDEDQTSPPKLDENNENCVQGVENESKENNQPVVNNNVHAKQEGSSFPNDDNNGREPLLIVQQQQEQLPQANNGDAPVPPIEPDLQVYFMARSDENQAEGKKAESLEDFVQVNVRKLNDPLETLYAKAEGLHAHGNVEDSCELALRVATEILNCPEYPSIRQLYMQSKRKKKKGVLDNQMSIATSEALSKISFLCNVLMDNPENHHLVFKLVIFGVEMKRSPAATKPLEVKLINQKQDLISLLKNITLHEEELKILREKAQGIRDGVNEKNLDPLTTLIFGNYIFDALVLSKSPACSNHGNSRAVIDNVRTASTSSYGQSGQYQLEEHYLQFGEINQPSGSQNCDQIRQNCSLIVYGKQPSDTSLGFNAALSALSVKVYHSEIDHPLLCEGIRRQRGELAISLLVHYKDDQERLDLILKNLLDKDVILSSPPPPQPPPAQQAPASSSPSIVTEVGAKKSNGSSSNQEPTQPTEASSHFMFELSKTVYDKAGGNSLTAHLFRPQIINQEGGRGIHRRLHMCSLRIALYALGLQNRGSPNWRERTYNGRASFIHEQALDIGSPAIKFLSENWEGYLTPVEVASIADKAACSNDAETKALAAEMSKSCLKHANNLDFNDVKRILSHCKDQSVEMVEEACCEIEQVSEKDNVCSDVLFATARAWFSLYEKLLIDENYHTGDGENGCCEPLRSAMLPCEQDNGATGWLATSHQDRCQQQFSTESIHLMHWAIDGRIDYVPTLYTPTYKHIEYVKAAYRVGIKALDALKPALHQSSKHNPKKEDDVLWLLGLSKSLGRECLQTFSCSAIKSITNPYVLHIISTDLIKFFETLPEDHEDRVNILLPVIDKCLDRFVKQTRDLMKRITNDQRGYVDSIIDLAQDLTAAANTLTSAGHYRELLRIVDIKKAKKHRIHIDTHERHAWINDLLSIIKHCHCTKCRTGREISVKYLTCNPRP